MSLTCRVWGLGLAFFWGLGLAFFWDNFFLGLSFYIFGLCM